MMWLELMPVVSALNCSTSTDFNVQAPDELVLMTKRQISALMLHAAACFLRTHFE